MRRGWRVLAGWGLLLLALASLQFIFASSIATEIALGFGAGASLVIVGILTLGGERGRLPPRPEGAEARPIPDMSGGAPLVGIGLGLFFLGWELGPYMMGIGGGVFAIGVGNLVREFLAERRRA